MAYATLGAPIPISQFLRSRPGVAQMTPGFVIPATPQPGARSGPSNEDVLRHVFGSAEKGRAMLAASAAEARQREVEEMQRIPRVNIAPPEPPMLAPHDIRPSRPVAAPLTPVDEGEYESEGDIIEDIAENEEEAIEVDEGSEFSGWGCGMGERPVGVTGTRREVARMDHVRKRQRGMRRRGLSTITRPKAMPVTPPRPGRFFNAMGVLKARKKNPFIKPGR